MKKTPLQSAIEVLSYVVKRDGLAEQTRPEEQPGALVRDLLVTVRGIKNDLRPEAPITRISKEHEE